MHFEGKKVVMKAILNFLKSRYFLIGLGILLLLALIWFVGDMQGLSSDLRFALIIAVLILAIIFMAFGFARANRYSLAIEQSIKKESEQQLLNVRPDKRDEIQEMKEQLETAIESLKRSRLGQGRRGKAALYALPWYVFIGPPTSGKTTAIMNSGLNFPMGLDRIRGVGGTRNCDWFFSDSAIFLDTAGRYITEYEDREEWISFLDTLKKNRPEKPINGVLIGISVSDLVNKPLEEVERHADKIRRRIDELVAQLDIKFPVYVVFTKCDLLEGFVEFFGALNTREREQIWGCTLDKKQSEDEKISAIFEEEFDLLFDSVINRRIEFLSRAQKRKTRHKVYAFPLEFAASKENLSRFVNRVFQPNPYQETPVFRGFYFTSGTQEGVPLEGIINKIAKSFGLKIPQDDGGHHGALEKKSYFIKNVFTEVIIPDQFMVSQTPGSRMRSMLQKAAFSTAAVVLLGLFVLLCSSALLRSQSKLNNASNTIIQAAQVDWENRTALVDNLENMNALNSFIDSRYDISNITLMNLDRTGQLQGPAHAIQDEKIKEFIRIHPYNTISRRLQNAASNQQLDAAQQQVLYNDVKAILLMTTETAQLSDEDNQLFLKLRLTEATMNAIETQIANAGDAQLKVQVEKHIDQYIESLSTDPQMQFLAFNERTMNLARYRISESPSVQNIYDRIIRQAETQGLLPITLNEIVGASYGHLFASNPQVPGVFTKSGWDLFFKDAIAENSVDPEQDCWVTNCSAGSSFSDIGSDEIAKSLEEIYFRDYERVWRLFLQQIQYTPAGDILRVSSKINDLSSSYTSPLLVILERATIETTYQTEEERLAQLAGQAGGAAGQAVGQIANITPHPLRLSFKWLHDLKASQGLQEGPLGVVFQSLGDVGRKLTEVGGDRELAAQYTISVLSSGGVEMEKAMFEISRLPGVDDALKRNLFEQPVNEAFNALMSETSSHLNGLWQQQVFTFYRDRIAGHYPFDATTTNDAQLLDVEDFFHPTEGHMVKFRQQYLEPILNRNWRGRRLNISNATQLAFRNAERISSNLFSANGLFVDFQLRPDLTDRLNQGAAVASQVRIRIHDSNNDWYNYGLQSWYSYSWPNFPPEARIDLETQQGNFSEGDTGEWAWFRLLSKAQVVQQGAGLFRLNWVLGENFYLVKYDLRYGSRADLFRDVNGFFNFNCPESLF